MGTRVSLVADAGRSVGGGLSWPPAPAVVMPLARPVQRFLAWVIVGSRRRAARRLEAWLAGAASRSGAGFDVGCGNRRETG